MKKTEERAIKFIYARLFYAIKHQVPMDESELDVIGKISELLMKSTSNNQ